MEIAGKRIVITGGSSGIGFVLAQALGAKGGRLLLTARGGERLAAASASLGEDGIEVHTVVADVATEAAVPPPSKRRLIGSAESMC